MGFFKVSLQNSFRILQAHSGARNGRKGPIIRAQDPGTGVPPLLGFDAAQSASPERNMSLQWAPQDIQGNQTPGDEPLSSRLQQTPASPGVIPPGISPPLNLPGKLH